MDYLIVFPLKHIRVPSPHTHQSPCLSVYSGGALRPWLGWYQADIMRPFQLPSLFLPLPLSDDVVVVFAKRSLLQTLAQSSLSITEPEQMWRLPVFHLFLPWKVYTRHTVPALCIECNNLSIASLFHTQNRWPSPQNVENLAHVLMECSAAVSSFSSAACSLGGGNPTAALIREKPRSGAGCLAVDQI